MTTYWISFKLNPFDKGSAVKREEFAPQELILSFFQSKKPTGKSCKNIKYSHSPSATLPSSLVTLFIKVPVYTVVFVLFFFCFFISFKSTFYYNSTVLMLGSVCKLTVRSKQNHGFCIKNDHLWQTKHKPVYKIVHYDSFGHNNV